MKWIKITKDPATFPTKGTYKDWKEQLAEEGKHQCVYCAIPESAMGGIRNFHVEHYRPKKHFSHLTNNYSNLYYVCPICNSFKGSDWPNEPRADHSVIAYPNPSNVDYNTLFQILDSDGRIEGVNNAAIYVQEKLYLNRPQLITQRLLSMTLQKALFEVERINLLLNDSNNVADLKEFTRILTKLFELQEKIRTMPNYNEKDIKRPL